MPPATMNAIEITKAGGPEVLKLTTRPVPQPAAGQVSVVLVNPQTKKRVVRKATIRAGDATFLKVDLR